ncbi:hypothetical protein [Alteriqipengyuania sp. 357]
MSTTEWPEAVVDAYYFALGRFLQEYANAESGLRFIVDRFASGLLAEDVNSFTPGTEFWARTKRQVDVVRALLGSQTVSNLSEALKLLMRIANSPGDAQELAKDALVHFGSIATLRNRIVHSGAAPVYVDGWKFLTSDLGQAKERHKAKAFLFAIEDLELMIADLRSIRLRIGAATLTDNPNFKDFADSHGAFGSWAYKPVESKIFDELSPEIVRPLSPFESAFSTAASYTMTNGGPLAFSGKPRR